MYNEEEVPELTPDLQNTIADVSALRKVIFSNKMYLNSALYSKWTSGLESGKIRGTKVRGPAPFTSLITAAHEAHIRLELWLAMSTRNYRHTPGVFVLCIFSYLLYDFVALFRCMLYRFRGEFRSATKVEGTSSTGSTRSNRECRDCPRR